MVELQRKNQENKKMQLIGTSNGIYGLLVLGGAFAAAFVATISNQSKRRPNKSPVEDPTKSSPLEKMDCSKKEVLGLLSINETTSVSEENHQCAEEDALKICTKLIRSDASVPNGSPEYKSTSGINGEDEGTICKNDDNILDNMKIGFPAAADYDINDRLFSFSSVNHGLVNNQSIKVFGNNKEGSINSSLAETVAEFEPTEEKEVEEGSDGTGDSSMESNTEAIWPGESIEELMEKKIKAHVESSGKVEKPLEREESEREETISKGYDDNEVEETRRDEENANCETTRKTMLLEKEKKKGCVIMQMNIMDSALDSRAMWVWALLGLVVLCWGHLICASFSSHAT